MAVYVLLTALQKNDVFLLDSESMREVHIHVAAIQIAMLNMMLYIWEDNKETARWNDEIECVTFIYICSFYSSFSVSFWGCIFRVCCLYLLLHYISSSRPIKHVLCHLRASMLIHRESIESQNACTFFMYGVSHSLHHFHLGLISLFPHSWNLCWHVLCACFFCLFIPFNASSTLYVFEIT